MDKIYWEKDGFWSAFHRIRIESNLKNYEEFKILNGEKQHIIKNIIYVGNLIYDVTFSFHKIGECDACNEMDFKVKLNE